MTDSVTMHRRRVLLAGALCGLGALAARFAGAAETDAPTVLFVCQFGSVKSAVAREIFKRRAAASGVAVHVFSRGITPEAHASAALTAKLAAEGIDLEAQPLTRLTMADLKAADIAVIFDPLPHELAWPTARDWTQAPSFSADYDHARRYLEVRIDALLDEIRKSAARG